MRHPALTFVVLTFSLPGCESNPRGELDWTFHAKKERRREQERIVRERPRSPNEYEEFRALSKDERSEKIASAREDCRARLGALKMLAPYPGSESEIRVHEASIQGAMKAVGYDVLDRLLFQAEQISRDVHRELDSKTAVHVTLDKVRAMSGDELLALVAEATGG